MGVRITVHDQSPNGRISGIVTLSDVPPAITLRDLIRTRVRDEVARHNARPTAAFQGLVAHADALPSSGGFLMPRSARVEWEAQADQAIAAFGRKGFFVLVDHREVTELDAELELTADTDIRFVRLVPLLGG